MTPPVNPSVISALSPMACKHCGVDHYDFNAPPTMDCPQVLFEELLDTIRVAMANQPRTLQTAIGPSEIGDPCPRSLIRKLAGLTPPPRPAGRVDEYRAWVGTQMHAGFERIFGRERRYLTETRLNVGEINGAPVYGKPVYGSCDLYDTAAYVAWDFKTMGRTRLQTFRTDVNMGRGPGVTRRVQLHLYGRGWQRKGREVRRVAIFATPRDGNLSDSVLWSEPYNEQVAVDALARCTGLAQLISALGVEATLAMHPKLCVAEFCDWCAADRPPPEPIDPADLPTTAELFATAVAPKKRRNRT